MIKLSINENDAGQRLDRFLKKYLKRAPLSAIYRIVRKDLKINGKRGKEDTVLREGDELTLYISQERLDEFTGPVKKKTALRQFKIIYEDDDLMVVDKPRGLLTHGDSREKKNTLMNQVCGYLQGKGEYDPSTEKTFVPSPVNRLDRNTTGLVIFGKNAGSLRLLTKLIRERESISKYYLTILCGDFREKMLLEDTLVKDEASNTVAVSDEGGEGKRSVTIVRPLYSNGKFSLVEVELLTGRTHQIRAQLSAAGYPLAGDAKYGDEKVNRRMKKLGLTNQLLHAYRLTFENMPEELSQMEGVELKAPLPGVFEKIGRELLGKGIRNLL
ncbi:MAG: RluA family pseudouridine synthase [Clostridiales bacterium]|nr:RluA family pseudouridine synthase [Clostridiales bacterium]MDD7035368.1 RluA family pseudouridine synthase [Bacillota bacterium]MDY2920189.1 RluA family pseudouridine synthase [Lentihominibacter sp.]